jgi:hypothetical protein
VRLEFFLEAMEGLSRGVLPCTISKRRVQRHEQTE